MFETGSGYEFPKDILPVAKRLQKHSWQAVEARYVELVTACKGYDYNPNWEQDVLAALKKLESNDTNK